MPIKFKLDTQAIARGVPTGIGRRNSYSASAVAKAMADKTDAFL
jgi:hypothetical protein